MCGWGDLTELISFSQVTLARKDDRRGMTAYSSCFRKTFVEGAARVA
jgi:hypothetical protein